MIILARLTGSHTHKNILMKVVRPALNSDVRIKSNSEFRAINTDFSYVVYSCKHSINMESFGSLARYYYFFVMTYRHASEIRLRTTQDKFQSSTNSSASDGQISIRS